MYQNEHPPCLVQRACHTFVVKAHYGRSCRPNQKETRLFQSGDVGGAIANSYPSGQKPNMKARQADKLAKGDIIPKGDRNLEV